MSTVNLKDMLVDKFVMDANNEEAKLRQVDLKVGKDVKTCYVVAKKKNIVQIKSIFSDDTVEELEIEFVQNSIKMIGVKASTYLYKGGMDLQTISQKEMGTIDLNKYAVSVNDLYVPITVILSPYFKERATNVVAAGAIKSLELISDNRIKSLDDDSKEIKLHSVINLNILDDEGKKVDPSGQTSKNIKSLLKINDNTLCMAILTGRFNTDETVKGASKNQNVVNPFDETGFIKECAVKVNEYIAMESKTEIEITAFLMAKASKEECELLMNNTVFRQALMLNVEADNTDKIDTNLLANGLFLIQELNKLSNDDKLDLVMDLAMIANKDKIKDVPSFKAQVKLLIETKNTNDDINEGECKMENIVNEINNDVVILNTVEKRLESIKEKYSKLVTTEQLVSIIHMAASMGEEGFNKIENEQIFKVMFGLKSDDETSSSPEAALLLATTLQNTAELAGLKNADLNNDEIVNKCLTAIKITDSIDKVTDKESFLKNAIEIIEKITSVEVVKPEVIDTEAKQSNVVRPKAATNTNTVETTSLVVAGKAKTNSNNKVYAGMVKYICNNLGDEGLVKYKDELTMIHEKLGKETLAKVATNNKSINEILNRYSRSEINESIVKGFEIVGELLVTLKNTIHGYEEIGKLIKLPLDIRVKLVYLLLEKDAMSLSDMTIEDRALFYIVLRTSLDVSVDDMKQKNSSGEFSLARARVSVRNREVVKKHIA